MMLDAEEMAGRWVGRLRQAWRARSFVALALLIVAFLLFGGLSPAWAAFGLLAGLLWAALTPTAGPDSRSSAALEEAVIPAERQNALSREILAAIADAALLLDAEQNVVAANPAAHALFAIVEGRHVSLVQRDPRLLEAVDRAAASREAQAFEMRIVAPVERHLAGHVTPLQNAGSDRYGPAMMVVLHDRTEAEQLAQMRADFVANASHELRTPLASLQGFVETLQGAARDDPEARERFLGIMQKQAARMSRLIDDLLSLSRIEMHEHVAPTGHVDLSPLLADAVSALRPLAEAARVGVHYAPPPRPLVVPGDRDELMQVAQNLVQNAIKYGKDGGRVDVSLRHEGQSALLTVADDGIGIAARHLPRLTERFYRVSAKHSRERGGTGLGLAIVKHIVNRHRGELEIESAVGKGSTFTVRLPLAET